MVIHTKEKAKIHAHEPKGAKIKSSNIYTVERGPKTIGAKVSDDKKKSYRKSTIHQSEPKNKGLSRFKRNLKESNTSIKIKNTNLHIAGRTGALAAGAVTEQVEGGHEVSQAAYLAYEASRPVTGTAPKGAALFRKKAAVEAKKRIKKVESGKKLAKKTAKKAAKDTAKTVAKETAKETAKVATKTATKAGTAVALGVGTAIGMAAGYAAGVSIEVKEHVRSTAKGIVEKAKEKGRAALYRVFEFLGIKKRLLDIRENVRDAIKITDKDIAKTALLAKGLREAGQTAANAFRTFADKSEVDYSQKEQKHPITKAVLAPMKAVKKMLVSMELHLDASIDKLDNLAMDVRMDKEKNKDDMKHDELMEADRKEAAPERVEAEIVYAPVVAETHEYQYNADAFEARGAADMKVDIGKEVSKVREDKAR
ncbi:DUF6674 family protein [Mediterraneibacter faecis]|nr:DUF6674 family protein [Mediterraneibacter faecis]